MNLSDIRSFLSVLVLGGMALAPAALDAAPDDPRYVVIELGTLESEYPAASPAAINASGAIAGYAYFSSSGFSTPHAFLHDGSMRDLGTLPEATYSVATGINSAGEVVGYGLNSFGRFRALLYADRDGNGTKELSAVIPDEDGLAYSINDSGRIVGSKGDGHHHAFYLDSHTPGAVPVDLHALLFPQSLYSVAVGVNDAGAVTGYYYDGHGRDKGWVYEGGALTVLPIPAEIDFRPVAISDTGMVVGYSSSHAVIHDGQTITDLGDLGAGFSYARGVNSAGHVVGDSYTINYQHHLILERHAFVHDGVAMRDLNDLIDPEGGWLIQEANAINDNGQIAAAGSRNGEYPLRGLLLSPPRPPTVSLGGPYSVAEGSPLTLNATASDPEGAPLRYQWDLDGDGSYEILDQGAAILLAPAGDDGPASRTVRVRVLDEGGLSATASAVIEIVNVAPRAVLSASPTTVYVNSAVTLSFSSTFDPGGADTALGFAFSYDCTDDGSFEATGAGLSQACAYTAGGLKTARGRIEDKDGGVTEYTVAVNVLTPEQGIAGLIQIVRSFGLEHGIETSFVTKLEHALSALQAGDPAAACSDMQAFINHARAQSGNKLTVAQADQIIAEAEAIRAALGCS